MSTAASPAEIADLMYMCVKRMRRVVDAELCQHGLSLSRTKVLGALSKNGACHQSALATKFELAPRTVTELVDSLERDGLVERHADPNDRRARRIHITPAGEEVYGRAVATRTELFHRVMGAFTDEQLLDFVATLRQIDAAIGDVTGVVNC